MSKTILIICTANICRSPVVEALLQDRLHKNGRPDWHVHSAGTWAERVRGAARHSIRILEEREGLDISEHRSRMIDEEILAASDLVLCMTAGHAEALRTEFGSHADKIYLLSEMVDGRAYDVSDPYGGPENGYELMVTEVTRLVDDGLPRIIELAEK